MEERNYGSKTSLKRECFLFGSEDYPIESAGRKSRLTNCANKVPDRSADTIDFNGLALDHENLNQLVCMTDRWQVHS